MYTYLDQHFVSKIPQSCTHDDKYAVKEDIVIHKLLKSFKLVLPYNVVDADDAYGLLLLVGDDGGLGLNPGIAPGLGEEAILACLALSFGEH